jgi:hypothetical protein
MYLSSGEIKLADPLQVKRIVAQASVEDDDSCKGFRTTSQLRNSYDLGFSTKLTHQTFTSRQTNDPLDVGKKSKE